jgi:hypothetical protein
MISDEILFRPFTVFQSGFFVINYGSRIHNLPARVLHILPPGLVMDDVIGNIGSEFGNILANVDEFRVVFLGLDEWIHCA